MKILVTGGTGFLGRRTVEVLASRGHALRLLVRRGSSREQFPASVEFAEGDVTDRTSVEAAARGCDVILHAAALVKILAPREEFDRINVGGLENVLAVAEKLGTSKVVYVSSFIALGPTENGSANGQRGVLDESAPIVLDGSRVWINDYERTKATSDSRARAAIAAGAPLVVAYPGVIYGPGLMTEGNILLRHILDLAKKKLPALLGSPDRVWNYAYVDDVAAGLANALERAAPGTRYVLGGENVRLGDFYALVGEIANIPIPKRRFPDGLAKAMGAMIKAIARLAGAVPSLTPDLVEIYRHDWAYDSSAAKRDLDYRPRSLRDGLTESVRWLRETGRWPKWWHR